MSFLRVVFGMLLLGLGGYMVASRKENPAQPKKVYGLDPLQDVLGDEVGSALHWALFVVLPFALGGYALVVGLGFDRFGPPSPAYEPSARADPTPDEHAAFQLTMTQARLTGAGFMVQRLEGGKGLRVSGNRFVGAILPSGKAWRVICDERSFDVASLPEAEAKVLECHQPG